MFGEGPSPSLRQWLAERRRPKYMQMRNEVLLAGYKIERVSVQNGSGHYHKRWRAFAPGGGRLEFWGNLFLDDEKETVAGCWRHLNDNNTSAPVSEMPDWRKEREVS
jgi:hypothetical protein